jgi:hypothetical protein
VEWHTLCHSTSTRALGSAHVCITVQRRSAVFKLGRPMFAPGCSCPDEFGGSEPPSTFVRWGSLMAGREGVNQGVNRERAGQSDSNRR